MKPAIVQPETSIWSDLYVDAFLELNMNLIPEKIVKAEEAIMLRLTTLHPEEAQESKAIADALRNLGMLRRGIAA
jgi:hypothetical protein